MRYLRVLSKQTVISTPPVSIPDHIPLISLYSDPKKSDSLYQEIFSIRFQRTFRRNRRHKLVFCKKNTVAIEVFFYHPVWPSQSAFLCIKRLRVNHWKIFPQYVVLNFTEYGFERFTLQITWIPFYMKHGSHFRYFWKFPSIFCIDALISLIETMISNVKLIFNQCSANKYIVR